MEDAMTRDAVTRQRDYYERTAHEYEAKHVHADDGHAHAAELIDTFIESKRWLRVLDVGMGTGRGAALLGRKPERYVVGLEPVRALLDRAVETGGVSIAQVLQGEGEHLPFADQSFDIACSFGVLHHVRNPNAVVREMARVASLGIFISDSNRFGQGSMLKRVLKLTLWYLKLWGLYQVLATRGKGFHFSEGDGVFYSYSVYDSLHTVRESMSHIRLIPIEESSSRGPAILRSSHVLLCGFKERERS
jgi:SAM-dependent methyltransferase